MRTIALTAYGPHFACLYCHACVYVGTILTGMTCVSKRLRDDHNLKPRYVMVGVVCGVT